jgi:hypothetical protein
MNLGVLLWNRCNASCAHCAVSSGPKEAHVLSEEQLIAAIDAACEHDPEPKIGLSGGEAFLYFDRLCRIVKHASDKGAVVSVNTNGFWGKSLPAAVEKTRQIKKAGLARLVVSTDEYHQRYIREERVVNVIRACKKEHLEVELQWVSSKSTRRLADFLQGHGEALLNVRCREIPCHPVGRAAVEVAAEDLFLDPEIPDGLCPSAVRSISADGGVIPCCNTAGHLPSLRIGEIADASPEEVRERLPNLHQKYLSDPVLNVMIARGPKALLGAAINAGYVHNRGGYIDQCHLCHEILKDPEIAAAVRKEAEDLAVDIRFEQLLEEYRSNLQPVEA